ncbi:class I SAM-dependent methyltransferase [Arthrobacter sp. ATA002]|uniref:class I SAM-dependent methyltransferase n=1 Tax=Arthrobacter sp. ATA002 TaxID=2991715 RepID=UPI003FA4B572
MVVANFAALPFPDASFNIVFSRVGVIAPHHQERADELFRVCRPGGRTWLIN